jgi:hypothetical protein
MGTRQYASHTHRPLNEHEDGRVPEEIWTTVKRILTIPTRVFNRYTQSNTTHQMATCFGIF